MESFGIEDELNKSGRIVSPNVGRSMLPFIRQGRDIMVIEKRPEGRLDNGDAVLFKRGDKFVLHRIVEVLPEGYLMRGDNQYSCEKVSEENVIGRLAAIVRGGKKEVKVDNVGYRFFLEMWKLSYPVRKVALKAKGLAGRCYKKLKGSNR